MEAQKQLWADELAEWKASGDRSAAEVSQWWATRAASEALGTANFADAMRHANEEIVRVLDDTRQKTNEYQKLLQSVQNDQIEGVQKAPDLSIVGRDTRNTAAYAQNVNRERLDERQSGYDVDDARIQANLGAGSITQEDAARQTATLHARQYADALADIKAAQDKLDANQNLSASDRKAQQSGIDVQQTQLDGKRQVQVIQDNAAIAANSWGGQFRKANQQWTQELNQQLSALMTGQRVSWSSFFRGIGSQIANLGLGQLENSIAGAGSTSRSSKSSGSIGGTVGSIFGFLTGRAVGGGADPGQAYVVGERGPEVLTMGSSAGRITPNSALGGSSHYYTIDARNAADPAAVEAAVQRGIAAAAPAIIGRSVSATNEQDRRVPLTARR